MIATVRQLRDLLKGISANRVVQIDDQGLTLIELAHLPVRTVNAAKVYTLLDSGVSQSEVARRLNTSKQVVYWLEKKRKEADL